MNVNILEYMTEDHSKPNDFKSKKLGLYIGRFQPFHIGHEQIIRKAISECDRVLLMIGSSDESRTVKNPFTDVERFEMIDKSFHDAIRFKLLPVRLPDFKTDEEWKETVKSYVNFAKFITGANEVTLYGHTKDSSSYYLKLFPEYNYSEIEKKINIDATTIREKYFKEGKILKEFLSLEVQNFLTTFMESKFYYNIKKEFENE